MAFRLYVLLLVSLVLSLSLSPSFSPFFAILGLHKFHYLQLQLNKALEVEPLDEPNTASASSTLDHTPLEQSHDFASAATYTQRC